MSSGSRVKDLVVTATVATMVSAFVAPWVRRWMGDNGLGPNPEPSAETPPVHDDFNERLERLLEVPGAISQRAVAVATGRTSKTTRTNDVEDQLQLQQDPDQ